MKAFRQTVTMIQENDILQGCVDVDAHSLLATDARCSPLIFTLHDNHRRGYVRNLRTLTEPTEYHTDAVRARGASLLLKTT